MVPRRLARWARRIRRPQLALVALVLAVGAGYGINALDHGATHPSSAATSHLTATVGLSTLPPQAGQTVALIKAGGPFPYSQDGVVFANNEHRLPAHTRGYYHEYTVPTPRASDRATRRIVTGADGQFYYTDDHYESFELINLAG